MREATGELNVTLIVVIAIAGLSMVFFTIIWPTMKEDMTKKSRCSDAICDNGYNSNKMAWCYSPSDSGKTPFECPFRG